MRAGFFVIMSCLALTACAGSIDLAQHTAYPAGQVEVRTAEHIAVCAGRSEIKDGKIVATPPDPASMSTEAYATYLKCVLELDARDRAEQQATQ